MAITSTKTTHSHSKAPNKVNLIPFKFKKEDLNTFLSQFDHVDSKLDIEEAKKARAAIKKKITEIKRVHLDNKKIIMQYKKDLESYSEDIFTDLISNLEMRFQTLDAEIFSLENAALVRDQQITNNINRLNNDLVGKIFLATTTEQIQQVQSEISSMHLDPNDFDNRLGEAESVRTSMTLKAAARANEIQNAGGQLSQTEALHLNNRPEPNQSCKYTDTEMLNFLQKNAHPNKGWAVNINPTTGIQVYQVDDNKAPRDIRTALTEALDNHKTI